MKNSKLKISNPEGIYDPTPHGYSHLAIVPENHTLVYVAGQGGSYSDGILSGDFAVQVRIVFENIATALKSQGLTMQDVAKLTTLVVDHNAEKLELLNNEVQKVWPEKNYPVNTLIPVPRLALDGMLVEIDAVAVR